jgi:hypothetical protein
MISKAAHGIQATREVGAKSGGLVVEEDTAHQRVEQLESADILLHDEASENHIHSADVKKACVDESNSDRNIKHVLVVNLRKKRPGVPCDH